MKAIIIQDSDAANLLDLLKLAKFTENNRMTLHNEAYSKLPKREQEEILESLHAKFHYIVCRWLQEQGASCVR